MSDTTTEQNDHLVDAPTRPVSTTRHARRPRQARKVVRYTLDLDRNTHSFLRLLALQEGVEASKICRALLFLLESDATLRERVLDEIFSDDEPGNFDPDPEG